MKSPVNASEIQFVDSGGSSALHLYQLWYISTCQSKLPSHSVYSYPTQLYLIFIIYLHCAFLQKEREIEGIISALYYGDCCLLKVTKSETQH